MPRSRHLLSFAESEEDEDGETMHSAYCLCGWAGLPSESRLEVEAAATAHLDRVL